jgi:hypothetical protein
MKIDYEAQFLINLILKDKIKKKSNKTKHWWSEQCFIKRATVNSSLN